MCRHVGGVSGDVWPGNAGFYDAGGASSSEEFWNSPGPSGPFEGAMHCVACQWILARCFVKHVVS